MAGLGRMTRMTMAVQSLVSRIFNGPVPQSFIDLTIPVFGDPGVGKSTLLLCLAQDDTVPGCSTNPRPSNKNSGVEMRLKCIPRSVSAFFTEYRQFGTIHLEAGPQLVYLVCSLVDRKSLAHIRDVWIPRVLAYVDASRIVLIGTKADLRDRMLAREKEEAKAESGGGGAAKVPVHLPLLEPSEHAIFHAGNVPGEVLLNVFSRLPTPDVVRVSEVCKRWRTLAEDDFVWKGRTKGSPITSEELRGFATSVDIKLCFETAVTAESSSGMKELIMKSFKVGRVRHQADMRDRARAMTSTPWQAPAGVRSGAASSAS